MGKFNFAFAWDKIVNLHMCICKNNICIWSDPGAILPLCKYTTMCICIRMRHLLIPSKICTPEYIYTRVFLAHANWTQVEFKLLDISTIGSTNGATGCHISTFIKVFFNINIGKNSRNGPWQNCKFCASKNPERTLNLTVYCACHICFRLATSFGKSYCSCYTPRVFYKKGCLRIR